MNLKFELVAAYDINTFNELVNQHLAEGWKFLQDATVIVSEHEGLQGSGYQYSIPMLVEEKENA